MSPHFDKLRTRLSRIELRALIPGKKFAILFTSGILTLFLLLTGSALYTSRPSFCTTCHYMEPFYDSWEMSSHSDVSCTTCHFPPGLRGTIRGKLAGLEQVISYVGRSYARRKPWAEIDDASCLQSGCHETRALEGVVPFKGVVFDHSHHLGELRRGKQLRCTSCHSQVVQGEHLLVTESTCFLCHMKKAGDVDLALTEKLSNCRTCHDWEAVPAEHLADFRFDHSQVLEQDLQCTQCHNQTMVGDGFVPRENCNSCHFEPDRLDKYAETELMHRVHITDHKIECSQCHLTIQHKIQRITAETQLDCSTCHDETHSEQLSLFVGRDQNGHIGSPNPMLEAGINCASCHLFHEQLIGTAEVRTANPESCESCHGKGYARLLNLWEASAEIKLTELRNEIARVERTVRALQPTDLAGAQHDIQDATYAMRLVEVGKAVHNMTFTDQLIHNSYEKLNSALTKAGADYQISGWHTGTPVPSECANCHTGGEVTTTTYQGRSFDHEIHVIEQNVACNTCHSNSIEHGQLVITNQGCNSCHHDPNQNDIVENCASCHETEAAFYSGTYLEKDWPDFMFDEDVTCEDCHWTDDRVQRPRASICIDCHDDDYEALAEEWKTDVQALIDEIRLLLESVPASFQRSEEYRLAMQVLADLGPTAANGIHNNELSIDVLSDIRRTLRDAISPPEN